MNEWKSPPGQPAPIEVVLTSLNHSAFIEEAIDSIASAFGKGVRVIHVDAGSTDSTREQARHRFEANGQPFDQIHGRFTTMETLAAADGAVSSAQVVLLSSDDLLEAAYGATVYSIMSAFPRDTCFNFGLTTFSDATHITGRSTPKWTNSDFLNRRLVCATNPGRAPGALVPWNLLRRIGFFSRHQRSVVEDYLLWCEIVSTGHMRRVESPLVRYRLHSASASHAVETPQYAWSIGYAAGVARELVVKAVDLCSHRQFRRTWRGRLSEEAKIHYDRGYAVGTLVGAGM